MSSKAAKALTQAEKEEKSAKFAVLYEHWLETAQNKKKTIDIAHLVHGKFPSLVFLVFHLLTLWNAMYNIMQYGHISL